MQLEVKWLEPTEEELEKQNMKYFDDIKKNKDIYAAQEEENNQNEHKNKSNQQSPALVSISDMPTSNSNATLAILISKLDQLEANQFELKRQNKELNKKMSTIVNLLTIRNNQSSISIQEDPEGVLPSKQLKGIDIDNSSNSSD